MKIRKNNNICQVLACALKNVFLFLILEILFRRGWPTSVILLLLVVVAQLALTLRCHPPLCLHHLLGLARSRWLVLAAVGAVSTVAVALGGVEGLQVRWRVGARIAAAEVADAVVSWAATCKDRISLSCGRCRCRCHCRADGCGCCCCRCRGGRGLGRRTGVGRQSRTYRIALGILRVDHPLASIRDGRLELGRPCRS